MKLGKILFAIALATSLSFGASAKADSLGFDARGIAANGNPLGSIIAATQFNFSTAAGTNTQTTIANPTGIFASIPGSTVVGSTILNLAAAGGTAAPYLTLTLGGFSFVATTLESDFNAPNGFARIIDLSGVITGPPGFTTRTADFTLSFTQARGAGNTISYSGTLATSPIPEPASVGMLAVGGLGLVGLARRRAARPA